MTQKEEHGNEPAERIRSGVLKLEFGQDTAFERELRRRVDDFFRSTGRRKRGGRPMYIKTAIILAWFAVSYVLLVFVARGYCRALPLAAANGNDRLICGIRTLS